MQHPSAILVARALDLMVHENRRSATHRLTGWRDGFGIAISATHGHAAWDMGPLEITIDSAGAIPKSILARRSAGVHVRSTHDDYFDRAIAVSGDLIRIAAMFD